MKMWANIHWECEHGGEVRVFDTPDPVLYVDNYEYALPFFVRKRYDEPTVAGKLGDVELTCANKSPTPAQGRAICDAFNSAGWGILSTRVKDGKPHTIEVTRIYWDHREYEARCGDTGTDTVAADGQEPEPASGAGAGEEQTDNTGPRLG